MKQNLLACGACGSTEFYQATVNEGYTIGPKGEILIGFTRRLNDDRICATCGKRLIKDDDLEMSKKTMELTEDEAEAIRYTLSRASAES